MDSIGGTVTCVIRNVPAGLGEPVFDKFEAKLGHAMLSIPATKAFEIGSGFRGTEVPGSKHNDLFVRREDGRLGTTTNWSGGVQGGITNGETIYFKCVPHTALLTGRKDVDLLVESASSPLRLSLEPRILLSMTARRVCSQLEGVMIPALSPVRSLSSRPWLPWS